MISIFRALVLLLLSSKICANNTTDMLTLLSFKSHISDPNRTLDTWNQSLHFCRWPGVTCGARHPDRVIALNLTNFGLSGRIPPVVANLTFLRVLWLQYNNFVGHVPEKIGSLSRLGDLDLSANYLDGPIPSFLTNLHNLYRVSLRANELTGELPEDIGKLPNIKIMNFGENNLTGPIPKSIGNLSSLFALLLHSNGLEGPIPTSMGSLSSLELLQLRANRLLGSVPTSFRNLTELQLLYMGNNFIGGALDDDFFNALPNLTNVVVSGNNLTGRIPSSLSNATNLVELDISSNSIEGVVPEMGRLQLLYWLNLGSNRLEASKDSDWRFLVSLTNCTYLQLLVLENNLFGARLPDSLASLSPTIDTLAIDSNLFFGTIPTDISRLVNLTYLDIGDNRLDGIIPDSIGNLQNLHFLDLYDNGLTGRIPYSIGNLSSLNKLYLQGNELNGSVPNSIENCRSLQELDLSRNELDGPVPEAVLGLSSLAISLNISHNLFSSSLSSEVRKLQNLGIFDASNNRLTGGVPDGLGQCQSLEYLYLQDNSLEGAIPSSLANLKGLRVLDLSHNNLTGGVPTFLERLGVLQWLDLSYNDLAGEVPTGGMFGNNTMVSVVGNVKLCGGSSVLKLHPCSMNTTKGQKHSALKVLIPVLGVIICLAVFFTVCFVRHKLRKSKRKVLYEDPFGDRLVRVSYAELRRATEGFSASNLIGTGGFGSVYKGVLGAETVAVKVLNLERHGALKSFEAECEALRNIRHRNLVRVITSCSSTDYSGNDFKALVLSFMPNGSLDSWLHGSDFQTVDTNSLTLAQRVAIAIDVAFALDYLHYRANATVVHCDLKPSNVLLDGEMRAHVSDFGLARFVCDETVDATKSDTVSKGVKGTIGYVAPEYGMGSQVSTEGDVYSYGIILLELITGKRPTDEMFHEGLSLRGYVQITPAEKILSIVDPRARLFERGQESEEEMAEVRKYVVSLCGIGLSCSIEDPRERMRMEDVIKDLCAIKDRLMSVEN